MVVGRQLRVTAVGLHLVWRFAQQDASPGAGARAAAPQLGERGRHGVERERLTGQVRVRAEIAWRGCARRA